MMLYEEVQSASGLPVAYVGIEFVHINRPLAHNYMSPAALACTHRALTRCLAFMVKKSFQPSAAYALNLDK